MQAYKSRMSAVLFYLCFICPKHTHTHTQQYIINFEQLN